MITLNGLYNLHTYHDVMSKTGKSNFNTKLKITDTTVSIDNFRIQHAVFQEGTYYLKLDRIRFNSADPIVWEVTNGKDHEGTQYTILYYLSKKGDSVKIKYWHSFIETLHITIGKAVKSKYGWKVEYENSGIILDSSSFAIWQAYVMEVLNRNGGQVTTE